MFLLEDAYQNRKRVIECRTEGRGKKVEGEEKARGRGEMHIRREMLHVAVAIPARIHAATHTHTPQDATLRKARPIASRQLQITTGRGS